MAFPEMDQLNYTLVSLPLELLETIVRHLNGKSSVSLLLSSKSLYERLQSNSYFWKHVCRSLGLCSYEWTQGEPEAGLTSAQYWKSIYLRFVEINTGLMRDGNTFDGQRILSDLSAFEKLNKNCQFGQLSNLNQQVVSFPVNQKPLKNFKTLKKKFISECIVR